MPITTDEYPTSARRPVNSSLDCSQIVKTFGIILPYWEMSLDRMLKKTYPNNETELKNGKTIHEI